MEKEFKINQDSIIFDLLDDEVAEFDSEDNAIYLSRKGFDAFKLCVSIVDENYKIDVFDHAKQGKWSQYKLINNPNAEFLYLEDSMLFFSVKNIWLFYKIDDGKYAEFCMIFNSSDADLDFNIEESVQEMIKIVHYCKINGNKLSITGYSADMIITYLIG